MKKETWIPVIIALIVLLFGEGMLRNFYLAPEMVYRELPTHKLNNQESHSIILTNSGNSLLHNITISLVANNPIRKMRIDGPEIIDKNGNQYLVAGKLGEKAIQLKFPRLVMKSNYTLTFSTDLNSGIEYMIVCDETKAKKTDVGVSTPLLYILLSLLSVFTGGVTYTIIRIRNFMTFKNCKIKMQKSGIKLSDSFTKMSDKLICTSNSLQEAIDSYDDKDKAISLIKESKEYIDSLNSFMCGFSKDIIVDGVCLDMKQPKTKSGE